MKDPIGKIKTGVVPGGFRGKFAKMSPSRRKNRNHARSEYREVQEAARAVLEGRRRIASQ